MKYRPSNERSIRGGMSVALPIVTDLKLHKDFRLSVHCKPYDNVSE